MVGGGEEVGRQGGLRLSEPLCEYTTVIVRESGRSSTF